MGNRNVFYTIIVGLVVMWCASCERDHLFYETLERPTVVLDVDWSRTAFWPESKAYDTRNVLNGVTIFAFDSATHRMVRELPPDANWQSPRLNLDPGTYDLVVINDSRQELPTIFFNMEERFQYFTASVKSDTVYTDHPDYLAVSSVRNLRIQPPLTHYYPDRPDEYYEDFVARQVSTVQHAVTKRINIRVYVKGMNYCKGMLPSYMSGLSRSVNLSTRKASKHQAVFAFNLVNREFRDNSYTEALLTQSFNSFGFNEDNLLSGTKFKLTINFVLVDNSIHTVTTDVTPQFEEWLAKHSIDLGLDLDLDIDIALEVELPPAEPPSPEDGNRGMVPETVPWNDITQTIIL